MTTLVPYRRRQLSRGSFCLVLSAVAAATTLTTTSMAVLAEQQSHRGLKVGDFKALNDLYSEMELPLPDTSIEQDLLGSSLKLDLSDIVCSGLDIGDIVIDWLDDSTPGNDVANLVADISIVDADLDCTLNYAYSYLFFSGTGSATLLTENNQVNVVMAIDIDHSVSTTALASVEVAECQSEVNVESLNLDGDGTGAMAAVVNSLQGMLQGTVAGEIESVLCDEFSALDEQFARGLNDLMERLLEPYLGEGDRGDAGGQATAASGGTDPLAAELALLQQQQIPGNDVDLLDFQNPTTTIERMADMLLNEVSSFLTAVDDATGSLQVNELLRSTLLNDDGSVDFDLSQILGTPSDGSNGGGALVELDHFLGSFDISITSAKMTGLDSFTSISPLEPIGKHTLGTSFDLDEISLQLGVKMTVEAAPGGTAQQAPSYTEDFQLEWTVSDIGGSIAVLLAIDSSQLGQIPLGALMAAASGANAAAADGMSACLLPALYDVQLTQLSITSMNLQAPTVTGLESPGLDRIMAEGLSNIFLALEPMLEQVLPAIVSTIADDLVGGDLIPDDQDSIGCQASQNASDDTFVDFRDLLLPAATAKEYGGSGTEPYGSVAGILKQFVDERFLTIDSGSGLSGLSQQISVMTQEQSGLPGVLMLGDLVDYNGRIDIGGLQLDVAMKIGNVTIADLDTLGQPLALLDPVRDEAYMLNNTVTLGIPPKPVRLSGTFLLGMSTDGTFDALLLYFFFLSSSLRRAHVDLLDIFCRPNYSKRDESRGGLVFCHCAYHVVYDNFGKRPA